MLPAATLRCSATQQAGLGATWVHEAEAIYRPRHPETSSFYRLFEQYFEEYLYAYEERFESRSGPLRAVVQRSVEAFLACGRLEGGFARLKCDSCGGEHLLAFSCQTRNFCPSCQAKRSALFAERLVEELLERVPHRHFVLTIPRAIRGLFERDRSLLSVLSQTAYEAILRCFQELFERKDVRPGVVASIQTFGSFAANFHPHLHMLVTEGCFTAEGAFLPLPSLDTATIEELFRRLLLRRLHQAERLSEGFRERLLSWTPSGFSVFARQLVMPDERSRLERLARYLTRPPLSISSVHLDDGGRVAVTTAPDPRSGETFKTLDPLECIHAITSQIPNPGSHVTRAYGFYSNRARGARQAVRPGPPPKPPDDHDDTPFTKARRASWARLLRRILEVDPMLCPRCGGVLQVVAVITEPEVVHRIVTHIQTGGGDDPFEPRGPPPEHSTDEPATLH